MRISYSQHCISTDLLASDVWPERRRRSADFPVFSKLEGLFNRILEEVSPPTDQEKGKKRAGSPIADAQSTKKRKLTPNGDSLDVKSSNLTFASPLFPPPSIPPCPPGEERLPVWRHTFNMRYIHNSDQPLFVGLEALLEALRSFSEPTTVNVGYARVLNFSQNLAAVWEPRDATPASQNWLLLPLSDSSLDHVSILRSCYELHQISKLEIEGSMRVVFLPEGFCEAGELPFEIQFETAVSFCLPKLFTPLPKRTVKKRVAFIDECLSHLYQFLYGRSLEQADHHNIDIPYFYSILTPALSIQSQKAQDAMQPEALIPDLLPFQRRSLAWLLGREGKEVTSQGEILPKANHAEYSFWDPVEEGNHTFYYNRLSQMLHPEMPDIEGAYGGILAEEPGLGKTVEMISLILLNPAPPDRNPSMVRWDPEARLNVKAVKTTLIVTPPSLAGQWVDEINAHAPSLKILVYDGWSKLAVPIIKSPEEKERVLKLLRRGKMLPRASTRRKKASLASSTTKEGLRKRKNKEVNAVVTSDVEMDVDEDEIESMMDWCDYVHQYDVVITTYNVLRTDLNIARAALQRPRREDVTYHNIERPRSPLVTVEWLRVIMDEVQMAGGGKAEDMVSLIPRLASFAVSGTPVRSRVSDLSHVLKFLRVDSIIGSSHMWGHLLHPRNASEFASFFQKYAIRTVKAGVKTELTIPQQTRYVVGIELGPVEREVYDQMLQMSLDELGLDAQGVAASAGWQVDGASLRSSLRKLRAICTHPQVGQLQRQGDKLAKASTLKSMEAVLDDMKDKNFRSYLDDAKAKIQGLCTLAQYQQRTQAQNRYQTALETLQAAEKEVLALITELEAIIQQHLEKEEALKKLELAAQEGLAELDQLNEASGSSEKGKERERSQVPINDNLEGALLNEELLNKRRAFQHRLREVRIVQHRIKFLQGDVYHVLGGQRAALENEAYGAADEIRRDLLKGAEVEATRIMVTLDRAGIRDSRGDILIQDILVELPFLQDGCSQENSLKLRNDAHMIIKDVLNQQTTLLWEWREHIIELLSQKLSPGEGEADGQEYQRTLDDQGEAEVYMQMYAGLLADRREALLHERTLLAMHDGREKKVRQTAAALKAAAVSDFVASLDEPVVKVAGDVDLQPEHQVTLTELSKKKKNILKKLGNKALRTVAIDLHNVAVSIRKDDDAEKLWAKNAANYLRRFISDQESLHERLDADLALMRKVFNQRIVYFKQLQEISDSVCEAEWEGPIEYAVAQEMEKNRALATQIANGRSRQRYLANLVKNKGKMDEDDEENICTLCKCEFVRGYMTQCAHIFCEGCMHAWMGKKEGTGVQPCPMCRVGINHGTLQRFTVGSKPDIEIDQPDIEESTQERVKCDVNGSAPKSRREIFYNTIDPEVFAAVQQVEALGDYGSKVQTLVKHLLYLQVNDPGAKSIVFSAWADSLYIVQAALARNGIRSLRIDQNSKSESAAKRFRKDGNIPVLLLHGERENAGLNLTCASRVFLLESVVHHGFELQAIARIDRLGQTRPTEVYCYYAENTVEKNILDLAARQGLSLYTKDNAAGTLNVSTFELDENKKVIDSPAKKNTKVQKGDFIFQVDDMLAILFPHMFEDIEYLIPDEARANDHTDGATKSFCGTNAAVSIQLAGAPPHARPKQENAVAGPSRLA